jgi:hypothetical protein
MPRIYLIVRFDATKNSKPSFKTFDITTAILLPELKADVTRIVKEYTVIDDLAASDPSIYRVAVEMFKIEGKNMHISYGTTNGEDAHTRFHRIMGFAKELDRTRVKSSEATDDVRAEIKMVEHKCIRIKLRKDSFTWYEVVFMDVESRTKGAAGEDESTKGRDRKRRKSDVEAAVGEDMDIFEDEEEEA